MTDQFFNTEGVRNLAGALVRESGQNTQDAAITGQVPELVFSFVQVADQAGSRPFARWLEGAWTHLNAPENGLKEPPRPSDPVAALLVEDFNTRGLRGDVLVEEAPRGSGNDFCHFFRIFGRSSKGENDRGSWGVGRTVFPASSRANMLFAYSVRAGTPPGVLMGLSVLRTHQVEGTRRFPYGYFGEFGPDEFCTPVSDEVTMREFAEAFKLTRRDQQGLSVVVPWPATEIDPESIVDATVREYFVPIVRNQFVVRVRPNSGPEVRIDADRILSVLAERPDIARDIGAQVELARWAAVESEQATVTLQAPVPGRAPEWKPELFAGLDLPVLRRRYLAGERLAIKVPVRIAVKGREARDSYFHVVIQRDLQGEGFKPLFIREGLIVSEVRALRPRGVRALLLAEPGPLAGLLRDAEGPSHTDWKENSREFKGKYEHGPSWLRFVKGSIDAMASILTGDDTAEDREVYKDEFSLPEAGPGPGRHRRKRRRPVPGDPPVVDPPPSTEGPIAITQIAGGFTVTRGNPEKPRPPRVSLTIAYAVRQGNPFKQWRKPDFMLDRAPVVIEREGCVIEKTDGNRLFVAITSDDFRLHVTGFDTTKRDLKVRVGLLEGGDDQNV